MKTLVFPAMSCAPVRLGATCVALMAAFPALAQTAASLEEVRVSATRFDADPNSLPFGVSVITRDDIDRSGVTTVNEALMKLLGVAGRADFYGGGEYNLDLRGFGQTADSNQVIVVDGIRINEADMGGTRLAGIPVSTVERIEVLRGSGAVLYGQGATGGVIVITTKAGKGVARKNTADVYGAVGSFGLNESRANATLASGGLSVDVAANKRQSDNHRDNFKSSADGSTLQAQWSNDWLRVGASHATDALETGLPGSLTSADYAADPRRSTTVNKAAASINNRRQTVFASAEIGAWQVGLDVGQRSKQLNTKSDGVSTYRYDVDANTLAVKARHVSSWGKLSNALTLGHDQGGWERTVAPGFLSQQDTSGFYVQDEVSLATGTKLSAGYRTERIKQTQNAVAINSSGDQKAWELGLTQLLSPRTSVYGRVGNSFRLANLDELGFTTPGAVLQPQTSRDIEVGSRWKYANGRVELRIYRSELTNELGYDPLIANANSWNNRGANVNFDPTLRQGLELETRHDVSKSLAVQANLGVREATFSQGPYAGRTVPLVAGSTLALRADWRLSAQHSLNAGAVWVARQQVNFENTCKVPSHVTMDARYAYRWNNAELSLGVSNLLDRKFYNYAFGCDSGVTTSIYPEAGRAVTAAIRVRF